MGTVIEVENLKREYIIKKKRKKEIINAVDGISFKVEKGEIFGLLGQNGAGKTTTIKMLITLLSPTSGKCNVLGYDSFKDDKIIRKRINFIFGGELGVYRRLSAKDNLKYFANLYLIDQNIINDRIDELLDLVGLKENANQLVETFSKGMIQRLQIARGLINNPEIIFMDEPTIGLDPFGAKMLREIILKLKKQGKTILLTTHYMFEADELCDRIAIMNKGKIISLDTPTNLKQHIKKIITLNITVLNNLDNESIEKIRMIPGITSVINNVDSKELIIEHDIDIDVDSKIFSLLAKNKIVSFTQKEPTLEDAYIQLVGENQ